jgi:hypothetical protein
MRPTLEEFRNAENASKVSYALYEAETNKKKKQQLYKEFRAKTEAFETLQFLLSVK